MLDGVGGDGEGCEWREGVAEEGDGIGRGMGNEAWETEGGGGVDSEGFAEGGVEAVVFKSVKWIGVRIVKDEDREGATD